MAAFTRLACKIQNLTITLFSYLPHSVANGISPRNTAPQSPKEFYNSVLVNTQNLCESLYLKDTEMRK